jgi:thiosulfate/3-mercaptopyruvate sulfurtransferase
VYASLHDDLAGEKTGTNGRHPIPSIDSLAVVFGRLGISRNTQVVVYDQDAGMYASRLWWSLRYLGHQAVALLDGGWAKWLREGRPVEMGEIRRVQATFEPTPHPEMRVNAEALASRLDDSSTLIIDARAPERFEGRVETIDPRAGHIPGAANHYYKWNVGDDGTVLPGARLRERFTRLLDGRAPENTVIYCGSGITACHNILVMEHAGLPGARLYPGSWSEWSSDPTRPIETGPARR